MHTDETSLAAGATAEFQLPVLFGDKELLLDGRLLPFGYTYRVELLIGEVSYYFEKDEQREWRVIVEQEVYQRQMPARELLAAIAESLDAVTG